MNGKEMEPVDFSRWTGSVRGWRFHRGKIQEPECHHKSSNEDYKTAIQHENGKHRTKGMLEPNFYMYRMFHPYLSALVGRINNPSDESLRNCVIKNIAPFELARVIPSTMISNTPVCSLWLSNICLLLECSSLFFFSIFTQKSYALSCLNIFPSKISGFSLGHCLALIHITKLGDLKLPHTPL
jgi:hypothetical protein